ncbi:putative glycogen debranching enzyme, partial [Cutibacterium acnes]
DQNHLFKQALVEVPILTGVKPIAEPWALGP